MHPQGRKRFGRKNTGRNGRRRKRDQPESLLEQPTLETATTVPCPICGHPVDPKRMHFHMVRFHGASMRSRA